MRNLTLAIGGVLVAAVAFAQAPAAPAPTGPAPTGLIVGSGNFFSPIVGDLGAAVAFYRDGLGLDVQGDPTGRFDLLYSTNLKLDRSTATVAQLHQALRDAHGEIAMLREQAA